jgi:hypothetical protein
MSTKFDATYTPGHYEHVHQMMLAQLPETSTDDDMPELVDPTSSTDEEDLKHDHDDMPQLSDPPPLTTRTPSTTTTPA